MNVFFAMGREGRHMFDSLDSTMRHHFAWNGTDPCGAVLNRTAGVDVYFASQGVGTTQQNPATLLDREQGRRRGFELKKLNLLTSFHYFRRWSLKRLEDRFPGIPLNVFADSGGFSAMSLGETVRLADYSAWLQRNEKHLAIYANLDVIGDAEKTRRNQLVLEADGLRPIPVFHVGSDFKYLDEILERHDHLAFGGMVPHLKGSSDRLMNWLAAAFKRFPEGRKVKVHGFGVGISWGVAKGFPWHSIDSSSWTSVFQFRQAAVFDEARGEFVDMDLGARGKDVLKHGDLLRSYGFNVRDFYPPKRFDYVKAGALSVMSVLRAERWLNERNERR